LDYHFDEDVRLEATAPVPQILYLLAGVEGQGIFRAYF
jgi:hypothetical protein